MRKEEYCAKHLKNRI